MTSPEVKKIIAREIRHWRKALWLNHWDITWTLESDAPDDTWRAEVSRRMWEYKRCEITFYYANLAHDTEAEIAKTVLHELLHVVVDEMREKGHKHEERVVVHLSDIIFDLGGKRA